ncbi:MAG: TonB-dependent receptor [Ignavibacteria bacterium]|nr:TonB-dependent receptor [Ignavibacteria bacterium]MBT8381428.1 TonB-dependent receptor [Ignavibacteria bacterium]MBT8392289.1 TonB-dependent receptor [Ignavibacteria bacterium]NNJ52722.1 TonB-dependent receptor [Ignavibacteriaceae bacterium]NNL20376.1 TonB-dependent receptor [Ignavibacteriaceae bacterium]
MRFSFFLTLPIKFLIPIIFLGISTFAQQTGNIRGFVVDSTNGEALAFCNVFINELSAGASTNERGLYLIKSIPSGKEYAVSISYVGYRTKTLQVFVRPEKVTQLDVQLVPLSIELQTIEKVGEKIIRENRTDISLERISVKELEILPKGVETDIFRTLQFIPGVSATGDVTAKYYVRGGGGDQNLILLNGIEIYNPFHSLGLFSVIDPDMINNIEFYKGGFTSEYSGRLSSVMDVISKDGNKNRFGLKGAMSFLTAKGLIEGPIPNGSFMITGRKSYNNDVLKKFFDEQTIPIDFYDLSFKVNYSSEDIFENAKFAAFGFISNDDIDYKDPLRERFKWKNNLYGFEWLQVYDVPLFSRLGISLSTFEGEVIPNLSSLKPRKNEVQDFTINFDMNVVYENRDEIGLGIKLKTIDSKFSQTNFVGIESSIEKFAGNLSIYGKYKFLRWKNFGLDAGTRFNVTGLTSGGGGVFEPRVSLTYRFLPWAAFKAAWGIYLQEMITVSDESEIISVFEPWIITPDYIKPSKAIHYNAGIDINVLRGLQISVEGYYKLLQDIPIVNDQKFTVADPDLLPGKGESYGWEFLANYSVDPFNFTASYTLSWAYKEVNGWTYYPKYDTRHAGNVILEFNLGSGWIASAVWNYSSGYPFTQLIGFYDKYFPNNTQNGINESGFIPYAYLGDKNLGRLPAYHRLDLSLIKRLRVLLVNFELGVSAINVYDRKNVFYFNRDTGKTVNMLPFLLTGTLKVEI